MKRTKTDAREELRRALDERQRRIRALVRSIPAPSPLPTTYGTTKEE